MLCVESPLFFAAIVEDTITQHSWRKAVSTYPDLLLTQIAYMDDVLMWDGTTAEIEVKVHQVAETFRTWGLKVNIQKSSLYTSDKHTRPSFIIVDGQRLDAQPSVNVMGVEFGAGTGVHGLLQGTWQRAKGKFWANKHLLCANTPIKGRMQLLNQVVGGAALWNCAAFFPEPVALEAINNLLYQCTIWMLQAEKGNEETWATYRQRTVRWARQTVQQHLGERWSTQWLDRYWGYMGHVARAINDDYPPAASIICYHRTLEWWEHQQRLPEGLRHTGHFYPKLSNIDRRMNKASKGPWRDGAKDKGFWKISCQEWIVHQDIKWARGSQFALTW